ncbi:MAG: major capsid protein [Rikenellaceae bacterium]
MSLKKAYQQSPLFNEVRTSDVPNSHFDLSAPHLLSAKFNKLIPFYLQQDVLPGEKFDISAQMLVRTQPMLYPIMSQVQVVTHYFAVPKRLLWDEWETFITGGADGTSAPVYPRFSPWNMWNEYGIQPNMVSSSLSDYFGLPIIDSTDTTKTCWKDEYIDMLPFRAYAFIYNEYYRDQNLTEPIEYSTGTYPLSNYSTDDIYEFERLLTLRTKCWDKDYFTSALPFAQRGDAVTLPFLGNAPLKNTDLSATIYNTTASDSDSVRFLRTSSTGGELYGGSELLTIQPSFTDQPYADLSDATAITIEELRRANKAQRWLENNAKGGARYKEQILTHFGVTTSDSRLQRPEYLGGSKTNIRISEVLQTSESDSTPLGEMSGHGYALDSIPRASYVAEEHSIIIGIMSIVTPPVYSNQGINRHWQKFDKFDHAFPEFAQLGEQEVLNKELYITDDNKNNEIFGYQSRFAEYKFGTASIHGDFRTSQDSWHLARHFDNRPLLNTAFVESSASDRIFNVIDTDYDKFNIILYNEVSALRCLPLFVTPTLE